jgi:hypothetical protein
MHSQDFARKTLPGGIAAPQRRQDWIATGLALVAVAAAAVLALAGPAHARDVPPPPTLSTERSVIAGASAPTRVGRLVQLTGRVAWWDDDQGVWADAETNRALTTGDRIATAQGSHAELRIGSTVVRLGGDRGPAELELARIEPDRLVLQLHSGSMALRVRSREIAAETEVVTLETRLVPLAAGHYRVDRIDDVTQAGAWRGTLRVLQQRPVDIGSGQWAELWREDRGNTVATDRGDVRVSWSNLPDDAFASRVLSADGDDGRTASQRYVSPEMTGAEELDRHGRWDRHPEYGAIWFPLAVAATWAPFRDGRWVWSVNWGWTWVDSAPWGFAPSHYGRWVHWRDRWGWCPGGYVSRPVFSPAVVGWVGGPHWSVSVRVGGGPAVGWVPLAPRDVYRPWTPPPRQVVVIRPDVPPPWRRGDDRWHRDHGQNGYNLDNRDNRLRPPVQRVVQALPPPPVPSEPIMYGNQGVPNAVTVVPRDALLRRESVRPQAVGSMGPQPQAQPYPAPTVTTVSTLPAPEIQRPGREPDVERGDRSRVRQRWDESGRGTLATPAPMPTPQAPPPVMQLPRVTPLPSVAAPQAPDARHHGSSGPQRPQMAPAPVAAPAPTFERREPPRPRESQPVEPRPREERAKVPSEIRHGGRERESAR